MKQIVLTLWPDEAAEMLDWIRNLELDFYGPTLRAALKLMEIQLKEQLNHETDANPTR